MLGSRLALLAGGAVLGAGLVPGVLGLRTLIDSALEPYSRTDPAVVVWSCADVRIVTSIVYDGGSVLAQTTFEDRRERDWEMEWVGYDGRFDLVPDETGAYAVPVGHGDLDDGHERTVALRPAGTAAWCEQTVALR